MIGRSLSGLPSGPASFSRMVAEAPDLRVDASVDTMALRLLKPMDAFAVTDLDSACASITREVRASAKSA